MSVVKEYYKKAGGKNLVKQYLRTRVLHTAILQFLMLGRSKKALELLRLAVSLKIQERLKKKYLFILDNFEYDNSLKKTESKRVWVFWWQGIENAPVIVRRCYQSIKDNLNEWEVVLITEANYFYYVSFPEHIMQKFNKGLITLTHFSDLLRLELLIKYGGLWLDATVLCTSRIIPQSITNSDLFVYQTQKPGADGHPTIMSSWCIYAKTNNLILMATRKLLYEYWEKNTTMDDYFLLHQFFSLACEHFPEEAKKIPPFCNTIPHILLLHLFDEYDENYWNDLQKLTCFHKLSYKIDIEKNKYNNTYFNKIITENICKQSF